MLALLLFGCAAAVQCPPRPDSAERTELRKRLGPLVHMSQCPGPPTPTAFQTRQADLDRQKAALLDRIARSAVAEDLARARREDEEANRMVNEADCAMPFWDTPDAPENIAAYPARLEAKLVELLSAEAAFLRIEAACKKG